MDDNSNKKHLNRRKMLQAFGIATLGAGVMPAFATAKAAPKTMTNNLYGTVDEMKNDISLKENTLVRTLGYHVIGDGGGAEYLVRKIKPEAEEGVITLTNALYADLINVSSVNYKMFGTVSDGTNDDGVQMNIAHNYANRMNIPVINTSGEYWIKATKGIQIMTSVQWGHSIIHVDEKFSSPGANKFLVMSREQMLTINFDAATKAKVIAQIKPGATLIPEFAKYKNYLIVVTDNNDRVGSRSGEAYGGRSTKAREEFFFIEEHGRIIGDIAWGFRDYTSMVAYPGNNSYLVIDGGTFFMSGDSPAVEINPNSYVSNGFSVSRSRTIIRNQWVGLEKGNADIGMRPKNGFYTFTRCYDVLLENVGLIPWEKDRPGTDKDVAQGTYGIGGNYALNATFRNVTAEGSPIHWGVFGTNLFKNFRVEQCMLNRIDVHFYCWNLYIRDSKVGTNGITITGGGDLFVENTTCRSNSFISFRRDFGAKWDGDIRIRNCKHAPTGMGETAILAMAADNFDYKYPIGYGRTIKVEDMVVDFSSAPASKGIAWLLKTSPFSKATDGQRVFFPSHMEFKNVVVLGREQGMRLISIPDPQGFKLEKRGGYDKVQLTANSKMIFEDIHLEIIPDQDPASDQAHLVLGGTGEGSADNEYGLYPEIRVGRCNEFTAYLGANKAEVILEQCKVTRFNGSANNMLPGMLTFNNCKFAASAKNSTRPLYSVGTELGTSFINCIVYVPKIDGVSQPDAIDKTGFMQVNKSLQYSHINTRLGNDILNYYRDTKIKITPAFISMLKSRHELEAGGV